MIRHRSDVAGSKFPSVAVVVDNAQVTPQKAFPVVSMDAFSAVRNCLANQRHKARIKTLFPSEKGRSCSFLRTRGIEKNPHSRRWESKFLPPKKRIVMEFYGRTLSKPIINPCIKLTTTSCVSSPPLPKQYSSDASPKDIKDHHSQCQWAVPSVSKPLHKKQNNRKPTLSTSRTTGKVHQSSNTSMFGSGLSGAPRTLIKQEVEVKSRFKSMRPLRSVPVKPTKDAVKMTKSEQSVLTSDLRSVHNSSASVNNSEAERIDSGHTSLGDKTREVLPNRRCLPVQHPTSSLHVTEKTTGTHCSTSHPDVNNCMLKRTSRSEAVGSNKLGRAKLSGTATTGKLSPTLQSTCSDRGPFQPTASRAATNSKAEAELRGAVVQLCALGDADTPTSDQLHKDVKCLVVTSASRGAVLASRAAELLANILQSRISRGAELDVLMGPGRPLHAVMRALLTFIEDSAKSRGSSRLTLQDAQRALHVTEMAMDALTMAISKGIIMKANRFVTISYSIAAEVRSMCQKRSIQCLRKPSFKLPVVNEGCASKWSFHHIRAAFFDESSLLPLRSTLPDFAHVRKGYGGKHCNTSSGIDQLYMLLTPTQKLVAYRATQISVGCLQALYGLLCAILNRLRKDGRKCQEIYNSARANPTSQEITMNQNEASELNFRVPMWYMNETINSFIRTVS